MTSVKELKQKVYSLLSLLHFSSHSPLPSPMGLLLTVLSDTWNAVVQARQKAIHKRTFYYLEQLILKNNAHANTLNIFIDPTVWSGCGGCGCSVWVDERS